ncbi:hypothetical protein AURDEDRAFT_166698 [Auricularia subglabra TFB-10046 SS5]|nr:hypothetical protein AURDEDRAFT_166698 [Auricularia subglabra TFB-10046 SS5]
MSISSAQVVSLIQSSRLHKVWQRWAIVPIPMHTDLTGTQSIYGSVLVLFQITNGSSTPRDPPAAKVALFLYDFSLTVFDEAELVWPSCLGATEILFYTARYSAWPEIILEVSGTAIFLKHDGIIAVSLAVAAILSQALIVLRTWAIWDGRQTIKVVFGVVCIICLALCVYVIVAYPAHFVQIGDISPTIRGCTMTTPYRFLYVGLILFSCNDLALIYLTAMRYRKHGKRAYGGCFAA